MRVCYYDADMEVSEVHSDTALSSNVTNNFLLQLHCSNPFSGLRDGSIIAFLWCRAFDKAEAVPSGMSNGGAALAPRTSLSPIILSLMLRLLFPVAPLLSAKLILSPSPLLTLRLSSLRLTLSRRLHRPIAPFSLHVALTS